MQLEQALYNKLTTELSITSLVGYKIYPGFLPQNTEMPAISYWRVTGNREHGQGTDPGVAQPVIQIDVWGDTYTQCQNVQAALRTVLQDQNATWGGVGGVDVIAVLYEGDTHIYEPDTEKYHIECDYNIWHLESRT